MRKHAASGKAPLELRLHGCIDFTTPCQETYVS